MNNVQTFMLFLRLGRGPFGLLAALLLSLAIHWAIESWVLSSDPILLRGVELAINLLLVMVPVAFGFVFLKTRRGVIALLRGKRIRAVVSGITLHSETEDAEPLYVLDWFDADGNFGFSLPAELHEFAGLREGVEITVYRNSRHDSWWERDILGN